MKIIIDTNLWISYLISEKLSGLKDLCFDEDVSVFYCDELIEEFVRTSNKPKIRKLNIDDEKISFVLNLIRVACIKATLRSTDGYYIRILRIWFGKGQPFVAKGNHVGFYAFCCCAELRNINAKSGK